MENTSLNLAPQGTSLMRQLSHSSSFLPLSRVISAATTTKLSLLHPPFSSSSTYLASAATRLRLKA
ncbi:hypothetical protein HID58_065089 [Brassica napus]|uniref:Uncharacterized protein n=1 Tax=Brassica napus TaxID=3708 RepID=A0ABQ7ZBU6_BRANA|nr:hypothetical protein HID58_065089 [Brassica napus]